MQQTIQETIEQLHSVLCDYIEATYHIGDKSLIKRRKQLLNKPGVIHQIPYIESTPRYRTGDQFSDIAGLPPAALEVFLKLSKPNEDLPQIIYDPPYQHQSEAIRGSLIQGRNLIIMTGTGSGKTESFLLPILGKLAREANENPESFCNQTALRALILYPMNALVNDQLGRLRTIFGDPRLVALFKNWAGRPPRFARYTSRTPYAGIRTSQKDYAKLRALDEFYGATDRRAQNFEAEGHTEAQHLKRLLKDHGKWPAKPDLAAWFGERGERRLDRSTGEFIRAVTLPDDSELITRHEVQAAPPDLLVTNYSMLEYMLMRPIERTIFDATRNFLFNNPNEKFFVVLDEAHLYRGAAGAEVGLLLRRLRDRLNIPEDRFQVICATASFSDRTYAPQFASQLSGLPVDSFRAISGTLELKPTSGFGSNLDADVLASIDLQNFYKAANDSDRLATIKPILDYRGISGHHSPEIALYYALNEFEPMDLLINETMQQAIPITDLRHRIFPTVPATKADIAVTSLLALGSVARLDPKTPGLLPCRIHNFFRGLSGLWMCMDSDCNEIDNKEKNNICGRLYSQPRDTCECGARVLEMHTCRNCGTAYARAYTDNIDSPKILWSEPGNNIRISDNHTSPLLPLDLLLEPPKLEDVAEPFEYDLETGRLNPTSLGPRTRLVHVRSDRMIDPINEEDEDFANFQLRGQFKPCAVCGKTASFGRSYIQDHQTKGDEPFQAVVARQLQVQPPSSMQPTSFAPLQGRKVLTFSDSRQVAARLAPNLQMYSIRDSLRPLIVWGYQRLQRVPTIYENLHLEDLYLAILLAAKKLNVRLRPELKPGESFSAELTVEKATQSGAVDEDVGLLTLWMELRNEKPPEALLDNIVKTVLDRFLGLEALALASLAERNKHTSELECLPSLPGVADSPETKLALTRTWLRCWQNYGFWLNSMPLVWWRRSRTEGTSIRGHRGNFIAMNRILTDKGVQDLFRKQWLPKLLTLFTEETGNNFRRLRGSELTLLFEGTWNHCATCKSVHRPIPGIKYCLDCGSVDIRRINPDTDPVFLARKGFYRKPAIEALETPPRAPLALVAAEHTAQLNAPQYEDVFSKAEKNELLFQDINLGVQSKQTSAIDVLSSTTTMEVGIDIGTLSGVALRNMPPGRANYQQRSGRAGRRGKAVATVVAFGSADSHDEHYFTEPDDMIRGEVVDPKLNLDNPDIVRRHILAFLLQNYHQSRLPEVDPNQRHDLFAVLGTVSEFRNGSSVLNRGDFESWLLENEQQLRRRVSSWIPVDLSSKDRNTLLDKMVDDCMNAIDDSIRPTLEETNNSDNTQIEIAAEVGEERPQHASNPNKFLDRLLYCGKLPRYAFPTDVATFHVFDRERSTRFRPIMRFAPQQGLPIALTQYAPSKHVWIAGKCYTSGAIYSVVPDERYAAWESKKIYMECTECGFAKTYDLTQVSKNDTRDCEACGSQETFGPGRYWIRPPGFAHPIDVIEVTSPDDIPETSYATRAKLSMGTPDEEAGWKIVNERVRVLQARQHLLVSNTGPNKEGYAYCTNCGRIEASTDRSTTLSNPHSKPFPYDNNKQMCSGTHIARHIVLGTDFITDIALFSIHVSLPLNLRPGHTPTVVALRTVSEALATAACRLLEIEPGEIMAEFRPALTPGGKAGLEAEIFLYDTLSGGAGFSSQLANHGFDLIELALNLMEDCPENCDASCYRCLRSFKNKFEHAFLDRHVGSELLRYLLSGVHSEFNQERLRASTKLLFHDLQRQSREDIQIGLDVAISVRGQSITAPILVEISPERNFIIALSGPLTPDHPSDPKLAALSDDKSISLIVENELVVRGNLPAASQNVFQKINFWKGQHKKPAIDN